MGSLIPNSSGREERGMKIYHEVINRTLVQGLFTPEEGRVQGRREGDPPV